VLRTAKKPDTQYRFRSPLRIPRYHPRQLFAIALL
jgi:hypothetical protein